MPQSPSVDAQCFLIVGAAMQVHRVLGCGFLEAVYRAALAVEFLRRGIPFLREVSYPISYGGEPLHLSYRADFVCFSSVIVEVKALSAIGNIELAQAINYLKVSRLERGLILNFGAPSLQFRRVVLTNRGKSGPAAS